jgi:hypothetical protein
VSKKGAEVSVATRADRAAIGEVSFWRFRKEVVVGVGATKGAAWALWAGRLVGAVEGHPFSSWMVDSAAFMRFVESFL